MNQVKKMFASIRTIMKEWKVLAFCLQFWCHGTLNRRHMLYRDCYVFPGYRRVHGLHRCHATLTLVITVMQLVSAFFIFSKFYSEFSFFDCMLCFFGQTFARISYWSQTIVWSSVIHLLRRRVYSSFVYL